MNYGIVEGLKGGAAYALKLRRAESVEACLRHVAYYVLRARRAGSARRVVAGSSHGQTLPIHGNHAIHTFCSSKITIIAIMDSLAPAQSALRPSPLANPFRHFPSGSNPKRLKSRNLISFFGDDPLSRRGFLLRERYGKRDGGTGAGSRLVGGTRLKSCNLHYLRYLRYLRYLDYFFGDDERPNERVGCFDESRI